MTMSAHRLISGNLGPVEQAAFYSRLKMSNGTKIIGIDLFVDAYVVRPARMLTILTDSEGYPLQYELWGLRLRAWIRRLNYLTLAAIPRALARKLLGRVSKRLIHEGRNRAIKMQSPALAGRGFEIEPIVLGSP